MRRAEGSFAQAALSAAEAAVDSSRAVESSKALRARPSHKRYLPTAAPAATPLGGSV